MALRSAALIVLGSAAGASASSPSPCPGSTNPMISVVTDLSPACFEQCPQMCQPLGGLISEYMATSDANAVKGKVCADQATFACMFEGSHLDACGAVLSAGSALGVELPMSAAQLQQQCSSSSLRGGGEVHRDDPAAGNSTNITGGGNGTQNDMISAAGGRGVVGTAAVRLLGLLGPVALLFAA